VFLESVEWREQIIDAREFCSTNKLQEVEFTGRPVKIASGEVQHGFSLSCEKLREN
jgi:hypothetical protein